MTKIMVASGWWSGEEGDRSDRYGDDYIRGLEFRKLWKRAINEYISPDLIFVVDSNSPDIPDNKEMELWVSMLQNFGHSTSHYGELSGVSRSFMLSMMYCYLNDFDYWVYVEQDCLVYGEGIVDKIIEQAPDDYVFGSGVGTPQPVQHSLMIVPREKILDFVYSYLNIRIEDRYLSPEVKFAIAASRYLKYIPKNFFVFMEGRKGFLSKAFRKIFWEVYSYNQGFSSLRIGYGRVRPIDFDDEFFYFQHGSLDEIEEYLRITKWEI